MHFKVKFIYFYAKSMDRKNRELAKRNTELLEEISRLTDIHSEMLKESIKERYYRTRKYNKLIDQVDNQIRSINEVLEDSLLLRRSLIGILEISEQKKNNEDTLNESDTSVFKQTMRILDTIGKYEEDDKKGDDKADKGNRKVSLRSDKKRVKVDTNNKDKVDAGQDKQGQDKITHNSGQDKINQNSGQDSIRDKQNTNSGKDSVQITDIQNVPQSIAIQNPQKKANDEILKEKNLNKPQPKKKRRSVSRR
ncbi:hypothetical protein NBO_73g0019 [Nosema bombycis CQ1]|uniref:Uncharacterized protein n=1 Tax=Nosema bombycis (strain CQ1 / CVCC 102059) TaxID=578461 RepID=R0MKY6_NOSB1|nr:hypothetical protein NBO_73g0019 [Nosema bombycis CQ1]|eukprot:EOB13453.1 hypothetical protein NBO_73g0019 [Nosema bombycis CQ1]